MLLSLSAVKSGHMFERIALMKLKLATSVEGWFVVWWIVFDIYWFMNWIWLMVK